jgi:hypothetical protein
MQKQKLTKLVPTAWAAMSIPSRCCLVLDGLPYSPSLFHMWIGKTYFWFTTNILYNNIGSYYLIEFFLHLPGLVNQPANSWTFCALAQHTRSFSVYSNALENKRSMVTS